MEKPTFTLVKPKKSLLKDQKETIYIIEFEEDSLSLSQIIEKCPKDISYDEIIINNDYDDINDVYCFSVYYFRTIPANKELYNKQLEEYREKRLKHYEDLNRYNTWKNK
jgi:hypothetical protein